MGSEQADREDVATLLEKIADLLEASGANVFRIQSYRDGARAVRSTQAPLLKLAAEGDEEALQSQPDIGEGLARVIVEYVTTGRSGVLDDLRGEVSPVDVFRQVPGIGKALAQRIVTYLEIDSLEALEQAAHDGRLQEVPGFGPRRVQSVRASLAGMLSRPAMRRSRRRAAGKGEAGERPSVATLLEVDADYRRRAAAGNLHRIAPKRFNPQGEAWLPIMHVERDGWRYTALFSNTARAHELGKTDDWVVIYYEPAGGGEERQNTVVTETSGALQGKRVVRGREAETRRYYEARAGESQA
jgi:hypothetical protein